jgi:pSer/pThr/pTyr-binding forkhead associated (FHA) protein
MLGAVAAMNYLLWVLHRDRPDDAVHLRPGSTLRIGCDPSNDIYFPSAIVSRFHAQVHHDGGGVRVRYDASRSSCWINGELCPPMATLRLGDVLQIGIDRLWLEEAPAVDPAWLAWGGGTVTRLTRSARESGDSGVLPLLADALEEAGCTDRVLLAPLRGVANVSTSWVVELLSEKD